MAKHTDKNLYDILGVPKTASEEEIKEAYKKQCKQHHPDIGGDQEKMKDVNSAYDILGDVNKRAEYDNPPQPSFNPFSGGNPFGGRNPFGFSGEINLEDILNNINGFRFASNMGGMGGHFSSTQILNHEVGIDFIKGLEGGEIEIFVQQINKTIKFNLPPAKGWSSSYKIRIAGDDRNQLILQLNVVIELPTGLSKEKIKEIKDILSPEVEEEKSN